MKIKFSQALVTALGYARDEAMRTGHYGIGAEHMLLGLLRHGENDATDTLAGLGIDLTELKGVIDSRIFMDNPIPYCDMDAVRPTKVAKGIISAAGYEALRHGSDETGAAHLLLSLSHSEGSIIPGLLYEYGIDYDVLEHRMSSLGMLGARPEIRTQTTAEMLGPLGEQLTSLYGTVRDRTNIYS